MKKCTIRVWFLMEIHYTVRLGEIVMKGQFFGKISTKLDNFGVKLVNFGEKIPHFLEKLRETLKKCIVRVSFFMEIPCTVRVRFWKANFGPNVWSISDRVPPGSKHIKKHKLRLKMKFCLIFPYAYKKTSVLWILYQDVMVWFTLTLIFSKTNFI